MCVLASEKRKLNNNNNSSDENRIVRTSCERHLDTRVLHCVMCPRRPTNKSSSRRSHPQQRNRASLASCASSSLILSPVVVNVNIPEATVKKRFTGRVIMIACQSPRVIATATPLRMRLQATAAPTSSLRISSPICC